MKRIALVQQYLKDIKNAKAPPDQEILRSIKTLCNRLPVMNSKHFSAQYREEQENGHVLTLVSELTEATQNMRRLIDSFGLFSDLEVEAAQMGWKRQMKGDAGAAGR